MEFKNSFSILLSKFGLNFRVFAYLFITIAIILAIGVCIIWVPFSEVLSSGESKAVFEAARESVVSLITGESSYAEFSTTFGSLFRDIVALLGQSSAPVTFWVTFVAMFILIRFASSFSLPIISDIIHCFMSSHMNYGFVSNSFKNARLSLRYAFFHTIFSTITDALILAALYGLLVGLMPLIRIFSLTVVLLVAVLLFALRLTLSAGIVPEMIVGGETSYFAALKKQRALMKSYGKNIYAAFCFTLFGIFSLISAFTIPTFGLAFFVLAGVFVTFVQILQLVYYYGYHRLRYFVDGNTIVNTAPIEDRIDLQDELMHHDND